MPKFSANLTMLFTEVHFTDRFREAANAGFSAVEYTFPYRYPKLLLSDLLHENGLSQALFNLPAGDWERGERGIACLPDRVAEFRLGVGEAIAYATALQCKRVNCLTGITPSGAGLSTAEVRKVLVANLKFAAEQLREAGIQLLVEPINTFDIPGYYLNRTRQALELIDEVESDNLYLQYDVYHMQRMEGELAGTLHENIRSIGHIQIADNPGRHEPGTGEICYPFLFRHLDKMCYPGWVGCEYHPKAGTRAGLDWIKEWHDILPAPSLIDDRRR